MDGLKSDNKKLLLGGALLIVALLVVISLNVPEPITQLHFSDKPWVEGLEGSVVGVNTHRELIVDSPTKTFSGTKTSWLKDFFAKNLFSFVNVPLDSNQCTYSHSAPNIYSLTYGTESTAYHCNIGQFVRWDWGSTGQPIFAEFWEKTTGARMQFDNYFVTQYYPTTYTYSCYDCQGVNTDTQCQDFDGGLDEWTQSSVHITSTTNPNVDTWYDDYCSVSGNTVVEAYCDDNDYAFEYIACANGCSNGECLTTSGSSSGSTSATYLCFENDAGQDYNSYSTTTLKLGTAVQDQKSDYCIDTATLKEYYCTSSSASSISETNYICPSGSVCDDGECVSSTSSTTNPPNPSYDPCADVRCYGDHPFCYDSNNQRQEQTDVCTSTELCVNGACTTTSTGPLYEECISTTCDTNGDVICVDSEGELSIVQQTCGQGLICSQTSGDEATCVSVECETDAECSFGICMYDNTCGCLSSADCGDQGVCTANECVSVECTLDSQCAQGICLLNNECGCDYDTDCSGTSKCINSDCLVVDCLINTDCGFSEKCVSNICQPVNCSLDSDCSLGVCINNECGCTTNADCGLTAVCSSGVCNPVECTLDSQCGPGNICSTNTCSLTPTTTNLPSAQPPTTSEEEPVTLTTINSLQDAGTALKQGDLWTWLVVLSVAGIIIYFATKKKTRKKKKNITIRRL